MIRQALYVLVIALSLTGCSVNTVYISGEHKQDVIEHFKDAGVRFRDVEFKEIKTRQPIYIQGKNVHNPRFLMRLREYFGGQLKVYYKHYKNHQYNNNSGLYLPTKEQPDERHFAGNCSQYYIEMVLSEGYLEIKQSHWNGGSYESGSMLEGEVFSRNGVNSFQSRDSGLSFNFSINWNSHFKANQFTINDSNQSVYENCLIREY